MRPLWFVRLLEKLFPNFKAIAKLTNIPVVRKLLVKRFFSNDDIFYLPLDKLIPVNQSLGEYEEMVLPSQVVEHFVNEATYHWIMNFCICRESMDCQDYPIQLGCLFLGKSVLEINPHIGKLVSKEEALNHLKKCREAGLVHMIGRSNLDKQWLGVKDGSQLLTICNCCPCCCLWRIIPTLPSKIGAKIKRMPGIKFQINENCIACGVCVKICFVNAIHLVDNKAVISDACRGCGRCMDKCPQNAIEIKITDKFSIENVISELNERVFLQ